MRSLALLALAPLAFAAERKLDLNLQRRGEPPRVPMRPGRHHRWQDGFNHDGLGGNEGDGPDKEDQSYVFNQLIDHFPDDDRYSPHPDDDDEWENRWEQRYWIDASYYEKGGPVIFYDPGEGPGSQRQIANYSTTGALAKQLKAMVISLEHRYFGESYPIRDLSTDNLRFLTVDQAMADSAYFATRVQNDDFPDITAPNTPWYLIGGSYPGGKAIFQRLAYPTLFHGAIASSAVTHPDDNQWSYYDQTYQMLPPACSALLVTHATTIDRLWALNDKTIDSEVLGAFGLGYHADYDHFGFALRIFDSFDRFQTEAQYGMSDGSYDPENNRFGPTLDGLCSNVTNPTVPKGEASSYLNATLYDAVAEILKSPDESVTKAWAKADITYAGSDVTDEMLDDVVASFAMWTTALGFDIETLQCGGAAPESCFSTAPFDQDALIEITEDAGGRTWTWLVCNEWTYMQTAAPEGTPSLVSRELSTDNLRRYFCDNQFPDGEYYSLKTPTNTESITAFGDLTIEGDRIFQTGGQHDNWRGVTAFAEGNEAQLQNTPTSPAILIPGAAHCFDLAVATADDVWGVRLAPTFKAMVAATSGWVKDWKAPSSSSDSGSQGASEGGARNWSPATPQEEAILNAADIVSNTKQNASSNNDDDEKPWYKKPVVWAAAGGGLALLAALGAIGAWLLRRRSNKGRSYFPVGHEAPQLETSQAHGSGGFYNGYGSMGGKR